MSLAEQLRKHFEKSTPEELQKEWDEIKHWNEIGPSCDEYFGFWKKHGSYPQNKSI